MEAKNQSSGQRDKFAEAAHSLECDESEERFDAALSFASALRDDAPFADRFMLC